MRKSNVTFTKKNNRVSATYDPENLDPETLYFPQEIAPKIGVRKETINFWRTKGCKFVGRKTKIRWVHEFEEAFAKREVEKLLGV
jgi:hypothetical protein